MNAVVVIADDLSGAAELAGVAWRHGLTAEVQTTFSADSGADVVCIDTDTRGASKDEAERCVAAVARNVMATKPSWIFKKCDSVLRGFVAVEAEAVARTIGAQTITLVSANPSRGRIVRDGSYLVDGRPLHETEFARDPHHPRVSSRVTDLLGSAAERIELPDVVTTADVTRLAQALDANTLAVGAADFFEALLRSRCPTKARIGEPAVAKTEVFRRTLLVCGSAFAWPSRRQDAQRAGIPVFESHDDVTAVVAGLGAKGRALIGIGKSAATASESGRLTLALAERVQRVLAEVSVDLILLEGGATAAAVVRRLNWSRLSVSASHETVAEFAPVGPTGPAAVIKPGSYPWPAQLWPSSRPLTP